MKRLSFRQVLEITSGKPVEELILVGGQALNAWAEALGIADEASEGLYGAALSDDIDFLGLAPAAISLADALGAKVAIAGPDDHTPNAAVLTLDFEGEKSVIDVLHSLKGFSEHDLRSVRQWAALPQLPAASGNRLRVMHPVHCLQSQLENVYGEALNRRDSADGDRNANRVRLACEVARRAVMRYVESGDIGSARTTVEYVYGLSRRPPALRARAVDGINVVEGMARDGRLGRDFLQKRLPQLDAQLEKAISKYQGLLRKRAELAGRKALGGKDPAAPTA